MAEAFNILHVMFHEATACHVTGEIVELLNIFQEHLKAVREQRSTFEPWKDMAEMAGRILTLCNSYTPHDMKEMCCISLKEMLMLWPREMLNTIVPLLHR